MHWTPLLPLLPILSLPPLTLGLQTTRISITFTPRCPPPPQDQDSPAAHPADLDPEEWFSTSLNVRSGVCQPIPVPLPVPVSVGYSVSEVSHVSVSASFSRGNSAEREREGEKCVVRLWEVPGCLDAPIIEEEIDVSAEVLESGEEVKSECRRRMFPALNEVFVRVDCEGGGSSHRTPDPEHLHPKVNGTAMDGGKNMNGTSGANQTLSRRWQRRRLSLWRA
ncbi:uncharacterized protein BJX67DRAFT_379353 [Aspergillus lucknowensis]|uniref:Uncharacterized protein n=1 Tax=Aspergillus lucknowensis TaxID=176173 RepID=A0ABR4LXS0_9EURO